MPLPGEPAETEENTLLGSAKKHALSKRVIIGYESTDGHPTEQEVNDQPKDHP